MTEDYKTVTEIAEHFEVSETAVRKWLKKGEIETATRREVGKVPATVMLISDVESFLRPGIVKTASKMS